MSKLHDIKGYFDSSYEYQFNDKDMWEGKILVEDDGWFEGVVKDVSSSYTEDRFVFGVYHPGKVIQLFKWTPTSYSSPFVFNGSIAEEGYDGEFEVIELMGTIPYGVSRIITEEASLVRDVTDSEIEEVRGRIDRYKSSIMDDIGREFYDNSIAMRNSMCQIILRNYQGEGFTGEECKAIMEECEPVTQRVYAATEAAIKQYVKEMPEIVPNNLDDSDDDEFPF